MQLAGNAPALFVLQLHQPAGEHAQARFGGAQLGSSLIDASLELVVHELKFGFGALAIGDVRAGSHHAGGAADRIGHQLAAVIKPAHTAVRQDDSILELEFALSARARDFGAHGGQIVRMHMLQKILAGVRRLRPGASSSRSLRFSPRCRNEFVCGSRR